MTSNIRVYNPGTKVFQKWSTWEFLDYYKNAMTVGPDRKSLAPLLVDSGWYMNEGPGKTASPSMFEVIQRAPEAARQLSPGTYDLRNVIVDLRLGNNANYSPRYLYGYDSSFDLMGNINNNLIWGSVGYKVSGKLTIVPDGSYSIKGTINPESDNFNFNPNKTNGSFAWGVNLFNSGVSKIFETRGKELPIQFIPNASDSPYAPGKPFEINSLPLIDRGPAPNGYDKPWGSASGAWGRDTYGVSFMDDGRAAPASRSGAGTGVFGNDFGDANLPGRGGVAYASAGASGVFYNASYATSPGGAGPYDFAGGFAGNVAGAMGAAAASVGNLLASGTMSAGFMPGGVGLGMSWGSQSQNTNLPGFGQGGHNANWGGGSNDGVGFNSLADLGRQAQSLVSDAGNLFSTIGTFFSSAASSV